MGVLFILTPYYLVCVGRANLVFPAVWVYGVFLDLCCMCEISDSFVYVWGRYINWWIVYCVCRFVYLGVNCVFVGVKFWKVSIWAPGGCADIGKWRGAECLKWRRIGFYAFLSFSFWRRFALMRKTVIYKEREKSYSLYRWHLLVSVLKFGVFISLSFI